MIKEKELEEQIKKIIVESPQAGWMENETSEEEANNANEALIKVLFALLYADRQRWLKELLPEKKKIIHTEVYNGIIVNSNPFYIRERINGFNECLSLIKEKAGIKE